MFNRCTNLQFLNNGITTLPEEQVNLIDSVLGFLFFLLPKTFKNIWFSNKCYRGTWWMLFQSCEIYWIYTFLLKYTGGRRGQDYMVVGFTVPIQSVPITTEDVSSNLAHSEVYSMQHYVIKFVSYLRQVDVCLCCYPINKKWYECNTNDRLFTISLRYILK